MNYVIVYGAGIALILIGIAAFVLDPWQMRVPPHPLTVIGLTLGTIIIALAATGHVK